MGSGTNGADASYWINAESTDLTYFAFAGRLIGKAILEEFLLPVHLALPLLKHILAVPVSLSDLQFLDQEVYKNIEWLKANVSVDQLDLDFTVPRLVDGEWINYDLVPNGKDIEVNDENKYQYMEALLKYRMLTGVSEQLCTFLSHLYEVVPEGILTEVAPPDLGPGAPLEQPQHMPRGVLDGHVLLHKGFQVGGHGRDDVHRVFGSAATEQGRLAFGQQPR